MDDILWETISLIGTGYYRILLKKIFSADTGYGGYINETIDCELDENGIYQMVKDKDNR